MPVDQSLIGRTFPPAEPYPVTDDAVRAFVEATGGDLRRRPGPGRPSRSWSAFTAMMTFLDAEAGSICPASSTASSASPTSGRSRPATSSPSTLTVATLRQIGGNDIIGTTSAVTDADGALVCTAHRHPRAPGAVPDARAQPATFRVTRADLVAYAQASGDHNPIHQDEQVARLGRPARSHRARHVHPRAGRPRRRRLGRRARPDRHDRRQVHQAGRRARDDGVDVVVAGLVKSRRRRTTSP